MKNLFLSLGLILPSLVFGQIDRSIRPEAGEAPAINIKDSEVFKTENGITVILSENHKLPKVSFSLTMGSTPKAEGELAGLSQLAGDLIMSGTSNRTKDVLDGEVDYIGASLDAGSSSIRMSCLTKHMDKGLALMSDVLLNANFPESEVERIRKQYESNLVSAKSDAGTMASNVSAKVNFPENHPYGEVMTEETLANISRDAIVNYYKEVFTPKGSYLVVVGDINRAELEKVIATSFASWNGSDAYTSTLSSGKLSKGNRVLFVNKPGAVQSVVKVAFPLDIRPGDEDYLKLTVLNGILGGGVFGNRLMQNLREDKAYTYGCRSRLSVDENGSYFEAGGNFRNEVTDSAITEILYELDKVIKELVTDDELAMTKSSMSGGFARSLERPQTIARFALNIIKNDLPKDYYQTYLKKLDAVTKEDLLAMAKKYITASNCNIIVVGNEEILDRLKALDADGKIEKLDAFGNPVLERMSADISADELLDKVVSAKAMGASGKQLKKKLKKTKSMIEVFEFTMDQMPFPMLSTTAWKGPNIECQKMEGNGMVFQKSYFDGTTGGSTNMQTGFSKLEDDEIAAKKKSYGIIPEMNYKSSGMEYELQGMEEVDGVVCYVLKTNDGMSQSFDYFDKNTFLKVKAISIKTDGEDTQESTITYSDYKEYGGFMFADAMNVNLGQMSLKGKIKSRTMNGKFSIEDFK